MARKFTVTCPGGFQHHPYGKLEQDSTRDADAMQPPVSDKVLKDWHDAGWIHIDGQDDVPFDPKRVAVVEPDDVKIDLATG